MTETMVHEIDDCDHISTGLVKKLSKSKVTKRPYYLSFAFNLFFLGVIFCWMILQLVKDVPADKECPKLPPSTDSPVTDDTYYSCSPCDLMISKDADTMRLNSGNSYICCKRIRSNGNLVKPRTGKLLEKCQANDTQRVGALLHLNLTESPCTVGLHWILGTSPSYLRGGMEYDDLKDYGRLKVPSDGVYAVYSYIQFDSYTSKQILDKLKPEMHVLYKNGNELVQMNKFMLRGNSYTTSHVGPLLVELKAGDYIHVAIGSMRKFIYNDPLYSVFGIYKL